MNAADLTYALFKKHGGVKLVDPTDNYSPSPWFELGMDNGLWIHPPAENSKLLNMLKSIVTDPKSPLWKGTSLNIPCDQMSVAEKIITLAIEKEGFTVKDLKFNDDNIDCEICNVEEAVLRDTKLNMKVCEKCANKIE